MKAPLPKLSRSNPAPVAEPTQPENVTQPQQPTQPEPPKDTKQILLNGEIYLTQLDLWQNRIFAVGDRVVSLIPGEVGRVGTVKEINRVIPERIMPYDDLIVVWGDGVRDCLYFNQVGKKA